MSKLIKELSQYQLKKIITLFDPRYLPLLLYRPKFLKDSVIKENSWVAEHIREGRNLKLHDEDKELQIRLKRLFLMDLKPKLTPIRKPTKLVINGITWFEEGAFSGEASLPERTDLKSKSDKDEKKIKKRAFASSISESKSKHVRPNVSSEVLTSSNQQLNRSNEGDPPKPQRLGIR